MNSRNYEEIAKQYFLALIDDEVECERLSRLLPQVTLKYKGYQVYQTYYNYHFTVSKDGEAIIHGSHSKPKSIEEMIESIEFFKGFTQTTIPMEKHENSEACSFPSVTVKYKGYEVSQSHSDCNIYVTKEGKKLMAVYFEKPISVEGLIDCIESYEMLLSK